MFDNINIPVKLNISPIKKALIEFRFETDFPEAALYGVLIEQFNKLQNVRQTPFAQVPSEIKKNDSTIKYQVAFQGDILNEESGRYVFGIGQYSIQFLVLDKYVSWTSWMSFVKPIMDYMKTKNVIKKIEMIRLQYWDLFDEDIIPSINAKVEMENKIIQNQPIYLRTSFIESETEIVVNISNSVTIDGKKSDGKSLIDIECREPYTKISSFYSDYENILVKEHNMNKQYFFGLLKDNLLEKLGPNYNE